MSLSANKVLFVCKEEEMRRLVAAQRDLQGETSQSDWSEDEEGLREGETTDDGGLDHLSMAANGGLTDAEGAMSGNVLPLLLQLLIAVV